MSELNRQLEKYICQTYRLTLNFAIHSFKTCTKHNIYKQSNKFKINFYSFDSFDMIINHLKCLPFYRKLVNVSNNRYSFASVFALPADVSVLFDQYSNT